MSRPQRVSFLSLVLLISAGSIVQAKEAQAQAQDQRTHDAHAHGDWEFFAALDRKQLSITITAPIVDVVGFEHAPENEKEYAAIGVLNTKLQNPELLFVLDERAACALATPVQIVLPKSFGKNADLDNHHKEDHENHGDHEDHVDHHDSHGDHSDHVSNLELTYILDCKVPARLRTITITGFDTFPALENVDAVFLSDARQVADRLTRGLKTLKLK